MENHYFALMAQGQSITGKGLVYQVGMRPIKIEDEPFRIVDDEAVYYSGVNKFELKYDFNHKRLHKWGTFYHPCMMLGMPDIGGDNTVYVDTSVEGWYILLIRSKLEEWQTGPDCVAMDVVAWTPKSKADSIQKAGFRMFYAAALAIDDIPPDEFYDQVLFVDGDWADDWCTTGNCFHVFASIRKTNYETEEDFETTLKEAPGFLKGHILAMKCI